MKQLAPSPILRAGLGLTLLACAGVPISCTSSTTREQRQVDATSRIVDPIRVLEARAELEALNPLPAPREALLRRLVRDESEPLTPGTEAYRKALLSADEIDIAFNAPGDPGLDEPNETQRRHAMKLYARGRVLHQQAKHQEAAEVLDRASELDPGSTSILIALGEAKLALGDAVGANNAYERAVELGDRSASPLIYLASREYALGDDERVIALCTLALEGDEIARRSVPGALAGIMLGNSQIRLGYLRAGAESLTGALEAFEPSSADQRWRREVVQIMGRRASLWVVAGDAWSKVGSHARAAEAYQRASEFNEGVSADLAARRLAALLREGRPATAALLLVEHIETYANDLTPLEREWVEVFSEIESLRELLPDAIASIRLNETHPRSSRRALMALAVQGLDPDAALTRLLGAGSDANNPDLVVSVLSQFDTPEEQHAWAERLLDGNPLCAEAVAQAWSRLSLPVTERLSLIDTETPGDQLLATTLALKMGRSDLLTHLDSLATDRYTDRSNTWLESHAQASALTGRWAQAQELLDVLIERGEQGDRHAARRSASCLLIMQHPQMALERASELAASSDAGLNDLMLLSRISLTLDDHESALSALERAFQLDPFDTNIIDRILRLQGSGAPLEDAESVRELVRGLGERRPRSAWYSLLRASDFARNGLMREAERTVLSINAQPNSELVGDDLLLSIWKTQQTQGQQDALERGAEWLNERLAQNPNSVEAALALVQIQYELERFEQSLTTLETAWNHTGSFEIARVREQLLRGTLDETEQANALARGRLANLMGVDPGIEYARTLARSGNLEHAQAALASLEQRLPSDITLMPVQERQLAQVVYELAEHAEVEGIDAVMLGMIDLIEDRTGPLDFFMARTKVLLYARGDAPDVDRLISLVDTLSAELPNPENRLTLRALPVQVLLGEDRPHLAIAYATRLALVDGTLNEDELIETYRLLGAVGVNSDLLGTLDMLEQAGMLEQVIEITKRRLGTPERPTQGLTAEQQRADLAYTAGAMAMAFEREDQSESYMTLALSFDPDHGWSNNDLGYMLIERGERIDEAERMLEAAARALPDQASIIDSLGWLRYKQGIFEDRLDEKTNEVVTRGAISLLSRANQLDQQRSNATILLHLGDAFWRAGQTQQAIDAWLTGESMLRSRVRTLSAQSQANRNAIDAASAELRTLRYRIQDAEAGGEPDVAPIFEDPGSN
ncbi:MAG: hypothetical protein ACF8MF_01375 [Phycisphaerales bacterium JB052]